MTRVVVLDYGSGNLRSAQRALERVGAEVTRHRRRRAPRSRPTAWSCPASARSPPAWPGCTRSAAAAVVAQRLRALRPVLGICVGMQVLFDAGVEHGVETAGLGVLPGRVEPLRAPVLPHMGWNTVERAAGSKLFAGLDAGHPVLLRALLRRAPHVGAGVAAEHGEPFVAAVEDGLVSATQFHPEKSGDAGRAAARELAGDAVSRRPRQVVRASLPRPATRGRLR